MDVDFQQARQHTVDMEEVALSRYDVSQWRAAAVEWCVPLSERVGCLPSNLVAAQVAARKRRSIMPMLVAPDIPFLRLPPRRLSLLSFHSLPAHLTASTASQYCPHSSHVVNLPPRLTQAVPCDKSPWTVLLVPTQSPVLLRLFRQLLHTLREFPAWDLSTESYADISYSPYCDFVRVRLADQVLQVHRFVIEKSEHLRNAISAQNEVDLSDVKGVTGHVLVDYLYTRTLNGTKDLPVADVLPIIFDVYSVAKRFQMDDLRQTTQTAIEGHTTVMVPSEALASIKKACPLPDASDTWLRDYSKTLLKTAYNDVASFLASDIMADENAEGTISITEMLLRAMISLTKDEEGRIAEGHLTAMTQAKDDAEQARIEGLIYGKNSLEKKKRLKKKLLKKDQMRYDELLQEIALVETSTKSKPPLLEERPEGVEYCDTNHPAESKGYDFWQQFGTKRAARSISPEDPEDPWLT